MTPTAGTNTIVSNSITFLPLPRFSLDFQIKAKIFNQEGDLRYEYNPFHNLKDTTTGELKDFRSSALNFSLNNPVEIEIQPSYDGSVNLILNDQLNPPKLINSRFTPLDEGRYQIIDRKGNTDTNIYNEDTLTEVTRLYKTSDKIPYITLNGLYEGGSLKAGNYVFYFKYSDADGNESDIVAESGIVSCYVGKINDPFSTRGGLANELTNKIVSMQLNNIDQSYDYVNIYFTRSTGDYGKAEIVEAGKLINHKVISGSSINIKITGYEDVQQIAVTDLNLQYSIVEQVKSQAQVQNLLFFANVNKPTIPYTDLQDLALRIYPTISNDNNIGILDHNYKPIELTNNINKAEYYDAVNVYNYTGYWNKEIYRLGVVFIMKDDTLSPVFNIRGKNNLGVFTRSGDFVNDISSQYTYKSLYDDAGTRQYIEFDDSGTIKGSKQNLENTNGVVRILYEEDIINKGGENGLYPIGISFNVEKETVTEMKKYVKGFFFVRQKRIPTIIAQGISIGVDNTSYVPAIKAQTSVAGNPQTGYLSESFVDKSTQLVHDFNSRMLINNGSTITVGGLISPEATLRPEYFSEIFTGALFNVSKAPFSPSNNYFAQNTSNNRHFYVNGYTNFGASEYLYRDLKLTLIEDNQPLRYSGSRHFSTRVGIPEEAWKFGWFGSEDRSRYATNVIRGAYSTFVGVENFTEETTIVDIHIPGYDPANMQDYFTLRADSFHPFYAISHRYDITLLQSELIPYTNVIAEEDNLQLTEYRGDCFIGNFTTRILRNFQDPETPINDTIIDSFTWKTNYTGYTTSGGLDATSIAKINRGDVNAVKMGHWVTFKICSNINMAYRAVDESNVSEYALTGKSRSFFPLSSLSPTGESKIPDSSLINVGYNSTTSDKVYVVLPDVPYIKNTFDSRVMFSEVHINDAFRNGYRVFKLDAYRDLTKAYGAVTKILEWQNNLMVIFEDGVGMIPVNEKVAAGGGDGSNIYFTSKTVLPDIINQISTNYGSTWKDSVIATPSWVYGVDATAKKIWRTDGRKFELISDFKIQKFLNDNITLTDTQKKVLTGLRNIRTHYNAFKQDVVFTFYDNDADNNETKWSMCWNEQLENWMTRFSWIPEQSCDIANVWFTFDREAAKALSLVGYSLKDNQASDGIVIDHALINSKTASIVGTLSLKGYEYFKKYTQVFTLDVTYGDATLFNIVNNAGVYEIHYNGGNFAKYSFLLRVKVSLLTQGEEVQSFYDYIGIVVNRANLSDKEQGLYDDNISNWFWKHGQAGLFHTSTTILPTNWYGRQEPFEYEFIVADNPSIHKIFDNLVIISNDAEPDSFYFQVVGDTYSINKGTIAPYTSPDGYYKSNVTNNLVNTYQKGLSIAEFGRRGGNMHYKEDLWDIEIKPFKNIKQGIVKEARLRDKYIRIKVHYTGTKLAVITALTTMYTQSYA